MWSAAAPVSGSRQRLSVTIAPNDLAYVGVTAIVEAPEVLKYQLIEPIRNGPRREILAFLTVSGGRLHERRDASAVLPIDFEALRNVIDPAPTNSFASAVHKGRASGGVCSRPGLRGDSL